MIFIDSDNALGGGRGNVDDGFAIAALLLAGTPVVALASVAGNATEEEANRNNRARGGRCGFRGVHLRSAQAGEFLTRLGAPLTIALLGPLTNIAAAVCANPRTEDWCAELIVVGGNTESRGRWPPWWPYEFNLTADLKASRTVFASSIPWTVVPLNLLDRLSVTRGDLARLEGPVGQYLRIHSERWLIRKPRFRVGDLVAAMYLIDSAPFTVQRVPATMHSNSWIEFGRGEKEVTVVRDFDGDRLWERFVGIVNASGAR